MDSIIVGNDDCQFWDIANVMVRSPVADVVLIKLGEVLRRLDVEIDEVFRIRRNLDANLATSFESIVRGLEFWRYKHGNSSTLSKLVCVLQECDLNDVADNLRAKFYQRKIKRFKEIPKAVKIAIASCEKLTVITTTSKKLLFEWIQEINDQNIILVGDILNLYIQPNSSDKLSIVTEKNDQFLPETLRKLQKLDKKMTLVTEQNFPDECTIAALSTQVIKHELCWEDLTDEYQRTLMNKPYLVGQRETTLWQTFSDIGLHDLSTTLNDEFLTNLICGTSQLFKLKLPPVLNYYIERQLIPRNRIDNKIFENKSQDTFVFTGLTISELSNKLPSNTTCDTSTNQVQKNYLDSRFINLVLYSDFNVICTKAESSVHWLHYNDHGLTWVTSKGNMSEVQENVQSYYELLTEDCFMNILEAEHHPFLPMKSIILSDSPGMGKSVLLENLARTLSKKFPDRIVIFVQPDEFIIQIANCDNIFEAFVKKVCKGNKLSEAIMWHNIKSHKSTFFVEILIDGFDEVDVYHRKNAITLLKSIQNEFSSKARLWVTTRPHLLDMLENLLCTLSYTIQPLTENEQIRLLQWLWIDAATVSGKLLDLTRLEYYSERCLHINKTRLDKQEKDIAGIPLQCYLIANSFARSAIDYCDLSNVINYDPAPVFNILRITDLYKHLVDTKLDKFRVLFNIDDKKRSYLVDLHIELSLAAIFPGNFHTATPLMSSDFNDLCNIGIVDVSANNYVPCFTHRTFAEYLVAVYIVDNLYNGTDDFKIKVLQLVFKPLGDAKVVSDNSLFNLKVNKVSFEHGSVCYFIDDLLAERIRVGEKIPNCNVDNVNMYRFICAALSEDCMSLFQLFTRSPNWINYITSEGTPHMSNNFESGSERSKKIANILFLTVRFSRAELVRLVLRDFKDFAQRNVNVKMPSRCNKTVLNIAVKFRDFTVVSELLANWYKNPPDLHELVHYCISNTLDLKETLVIEKEEILYFLYLRSPTIINANFNGLFPLHIPFVHPRLESKLLSLGADINALTDDYRTVLHKKMRSASDLHRFLVEILMNEQRRNDCRRLVVVKDKWMFTALHRHILDWIPGSETLKIFADLDADFNSVNDKEESIIESAIRLHQDKDGIRLLINYGADINWRCVNGGSLLHLAVSKWNLSAVQALTENGLDVNIQDKKGNTPLHDLLRNWKATPNGTITSLLAYIGDNLDIQNKDGFKPLDLCLHRRTLLEPCIPIMDLKQMLKKSNNVPTMKSTLQAIVLSTYDEIAEESLSLAKELVMNGAMLNFKSENGNTLLFEAMELVCLPIIKWLVASGLDVNSQNLFGDTPLHHLMSLHKGNREGEFNVLSYLSSCGALLNKRNFENKTVMDVAILNEKFLLFVQVCETIGIDNTHFCKNHISKTIMNFLATSIIYPQYFDFIQEVVKQGVNVNHTDAKGNTMLHHVAQRRSTKWVKYFLSIGADPQIKNSEMRLPMHMLYDWDLKKHKTQPCNEILELLITKVNSVTIDVNDCIKLYKAVCSADETTLSLFLADIVYHEYLFSDDFVWYVMGCRSLETISFFCDAYKSNGFNLINLGLTQAKSALHVAVSQSESSVVDYLLDEQGFNQTVFSSRMQNLIHKLICGSSIESGVCLHSKKYILEKLLTLNKALVNEIYDDCPPLLVDKIDLDLIKILIENGADVTAVNVHGDNLVHLAAQYLNSYSFHSLVEFLFKKGHGHLFQAKGKDDFTILHRLVLKWFRFHDYFNNTLQYFEKFEVDFNGVEKNGQSVLVYAVKARSSPEHDVIMALVKHGCLWSTLFTNVTKDDTMLMLEHLIFKCVDVSTKDRNGDSIKSLVCNYFDEETAMKLLGNASGFKNKIVMTQHKMGSFRDRLEEIIVGDPNCKFVDVAKLMVSSPGGRALCLNLVEVLLSLNLDTDVILDIKRKLNLNLSTYLESVVRGLETWRAKNGHLANLSQLVSILQQCSLNVVADAIKSTYC